MDSTTKDDSPEMIGEPSIAPLTRVQPIHEELMTNGNQDALALEDENSDDEWESGDDEDDDDDDYADEEDFPTWDGGIPRAPLEKGVAGNSSGPPKKNKAAESKSGSKSGNKKDDKKDGKTDEEKDGGSGSSSKTVQPVVDPAT